MWRYWLSRGLHADGRRWLEEVLTANPEPTALRARALLALAVFDVRRGRAARLEQLGEEAVAIHRALPDKSELGRALHAEGVLAFMRGEWDRCWDLTEESRAEAGAEDHPVEVSARHLQGLVLAGRGQLDEARATMTDVRQLLATHFDVVDPFFLPMSIGFAVEGATHRIPRVFFEDTMLPGRYAGARHADAHVLLTMGAVARLAGELDEARGLLDEARSRFAAISGHDGEALALSLLGCLHRVAGDLPQARAALTQSLRLRRALGDLRAVGLTETALGVLTCSEGDTTAGFTMIADALASSEERQDSAAVAGFALTLASAMAEAGAYDSAVHHLLLMLPQMRVMPGNHRATAWGYLQLGDMQERLDHPADARRAYADAGQLFTMLGALDGEREVHVREAMLQTVD
jgi:tetratricopeptide (TPR) repeat protein